jgi:hypothetical protein
MIYEIFLENDMQQKKIWGAEFGAKFSGLCTVSKDKKNIANGVFGMKERNKTLKMASDDS